jgi:hypothetical protein
VSPLDVLVPVTVVLVMLVTVVQVVDVATGTLD